MNYWFWTFLFLAPVAVFSAKPDSPTSYRIFRIIFAVIIGYILVNLAVDLHWDLRVEAVNNNPNATKNDFRSATADGANRIFTLLFGWVYSSVYAGWWEIIWRKYYRISGNTGLFSKIFLLWAKAVTLIAFVYLSVVFAVAILLL